MDFEKKYLESNNNESDARDNNQIIELDYNEIKDNDWENEESFSKKHGSSPLKNDIEAENENDDYFSQNSKYYENLYLNQGKAVIFL